MKTSLWAGLCACALLAIGGCKAPSDPGGNKLTADLRHMAGTGWQWKRSFGGIAGMEWTPQGMGFSVKYKFRTDSICELYYNNALTDSARFRARFGVVYGADTVDVLRFDTLNGYFRPIPVAGFTTAYEYSVIVRNDSMLLGDFRVADGLEHTYLKVP